MKKRTFDLIIITLTIIELVTIFIFFFLIVLNYKKINIRSFYGTWMINIAAIIVVTSVISDLIDKRVFGKGEKKEKKDYPDDIKGKVCYWLTILSLGIAFVLFVMLFNLEYYLPKELFLKVAPYFAIALTVDVIVGLICLVTMQKWAEKKAPPKKEAQKRKHFLLHFLLKFRSFAKKLSPWVILIAIVITVLYFLSILL